MRVSVHPPGWRARVLTRCCLTHLRSASAWSALVVVLALTPSAWAQQIPGVSLPGIPNVSVDNGDRTQSFGLDASSAGAGARSSIATDAASLTGLREPATRSTLQLGEVLAAAARDAADIRIAAERVVQQEANVRRAWASVLPTVTLGGAYTLTCTGGGEDLVSCADRTTQLANPSQLESQADLFESIASLLTVAANASADPAEREKLLEDAAKLNENAEAVRSAASKVTPVVVQPSSVFSGQLSIALPLFNGRAFPLMANANDAVEVAKRAKAQVSNALLYAATRTYHAAVAAKKLVAIAERQVESAAKHKEATRARVEADTQPALSLRRAELDELRARQQLQSAHANYDVAIANLGLLLGRDEAFDVVEPTVQRGQSSGEPESLVAKALQQRPDVAAQRVALDVARRSELDAWMMFLPSVNLVGTARATSFTQGFVRDPVTGTFAITASVPLYDGGLRYASLRDSSSKIREESIRTRQLEDRVRAQVRGNLRDIELKRAALEIARASVVVSRTAREQAEAMFDAGVGTALDVSDTSLALFVAENDLARAELDLILAQTGLSWVLGESLLPGAP